MEKSDNLKYIYADIYRKNKSFFENSSLSLREQALENFLQLGFPNKKNEKYKYFDVGNLFNKKYDFLLKPYVLNLNIDDVFRCDVPKLNLQDIVTINGYFFHENKLNGFIGDGIWIGSLVNAIKEIPEIVSDKINSTLDKDDGVSQLNKLLFKDGFVIYIPDNKSLSFPLQVINLLLANNDLFVCQRNIIIVGKNASANIVLCNHSLSAVSFLNNISTQIYLADNASLHLTELQNINNNSAQFEILNIHQEANSTVNTSFFTLHGGNIRNNVNIKLSGENSTNNTNGLFLTDGTEHVDNYVYIEHSAPYCSSNQLFKGILDNSSTAAFNGKILVRRDAQKTNAFQKNNNLLLSNEAKVNSKPQLEIYADDVKCSHGATIGQLDEEAMFYMRSRGIGFEEARYLLMFAFAYEVTEKIPLENLKFRLEEMINKRLRKELTRCHNCQIVFSS